MVVNCQSQNEVYHSYCMHIYSRNCFVPIGLPQKKMIGRLSELYLIEWSGACYIYGSRKCPLRSRKYISQPQLQFLWLEFNFFSKAKLWGWPFSGARCLWTVVSEFGTCLSPELRQVPNWGTTWPLHNMKKRPPISSFVCSTYGTP